MKRLAIVLSTIILLAILSSGFSSLAQPSHIPHQNPATAKGSLDPVSLLLFFGNVFDRAAIGKYEDAQSLLNELEYANIPDELRYIINRSNALSQQLLTTLDNLESILDEASTLLARYQIDDAKQKLNEAEAAIYSAQLLLEELELAANSLGAKLGVFVASASSQIRQAYDRVEEMLLRLKQLIDRLDQLRQSLVQRYEIQAQVELIATELSLSVTPRSAFVGDSITAWGKLSGDKSGLGRRELTLFLGDKPLAITTGLDGSYATDITIPYTYVSAMTLSAVYTPSGDDIGTYLPSKSRTVVINTNFYSTLLEVSAPENAHPGLPITISGRVSSSDDTVERRVKVLLDNTQLAEETIQGQFNLELTPPQQISTGKHSLTLLVIPQGRYADATKSLSINISRIPIRTEIQVPLLTVIPKPIQVSGKVQHSLGPLQNAWVRLTFKDSSTTVRTSTDGSFTTTMKAPFDLSLVGPQELTVTIEPVEPWYASLQVKKGIFTINPASLGLTLVAFISVGLLVLNRARSNPPSAGGKVVVTEARLREPLVASAPRYEFTGIKGRILSAYLTGLEAIERATGTSMAPHTTLREFLNAITPRLPMAIKPFAELTTMAEYALYSAHKLDENTAARAELLAAAVKEELQSGVT